MYGKTLSVPDELIYRYAELATDVPTDELPEWKARAASDPRNAKHDLAFRIVQMYHGREAAQAARDHFERTVIGNEVPEDIPDVSVAEGSVGLVALMRQAELAASNGEARRLIQQNAVSIDGEKVSDPMAEIDVASSAPFVLKVGKRRYARITTG